MTKKELFLKVLKEELYLHRGFLLTAFGILDQNTDHKLLTETRLLVKNKILYTNLTSNKELEEITDFKFDEPLFFRNDKLSLTPSDMRCIKSNIETSYGIALMNAILFEYPYSGKVEYINKEFSDSDANKIAADLLKHDKVSIDEHLKYENAANFISCLAMICVPTATKKSIVPSKTIIEEQQRLKKEYANRLHDPAALSELQDRILKLHMDALKDDPSDRFFTSRKAKTARVKMLGMYGADADYFDESKMNVISDSLDKGWKIENIQQIANSIRAGSYDRAQNTALGGYEVKVTGRIFQNYSIVKTPCNTVRGLEIDVTSETIEELIGRYIVGDSEHPLTKEKLHSMLGKSIIIRSPQYCISSDTTVCPICMGDSVSKSDIPILTLMTNISNAFLSLFLAAIHGSLMSTHKYDYKLRIS